MTHDERIIGITRRNDKSLANPTHTQTWATFCLSILSIDSSLDIIGSQRQLDMPTTRNLISSNGLRNPPPRCGISWVYYCGFVQLGGGAGHRGHLGAVTSTAITGETYPSDIDPATTPLAPAWKPNRITLNGSPWRCDSWETIFRKHSSITSFSD